MEFFAIYSDSEVVGQASLEREGLYYRICCQCSLPQNGIYRIAASSKDHKVDLGVCVPLGDHFGMKVKIPIKQLGDGALSFQLNSEATKLTDEFVPLDSHQPFYKLSELLRAKFACREGKWGLVISGEPAPDCCPHREKESYPV